MLTAEVQLGSVTAVMTMLQMYALCCAFHPVDLFIIIASLYPSIPVFKGQYILR